MGGFYRKPSQKTMDMRKAEYSEKYKAELEWFAENLTEVSKDSFMTDMYKILLTSSDDYSVLKSIAKECILIKKISPCAHIINGVNSFYIWDDRFVYGDKEHLLAIKCKKENILEIEKVIDRQHNYDTPEITSVNLDIISEKYKKWFDIK